MTLCAAFVAVAWRVRGVRGVQVICELRSSCHFLLELSVRRSTHASRSAPTVSLADALCVLVPRAIPVSRRRCDRRNRKQVRSVRCSLPRTVAIAHLGGGVACYNHAVTFSHVSFLKPYPVRSLFLTCLFVCFWHQPLSSLTPLYVLNASERDEHAS